MFSSVSQKLSAINSKSLLKKDATPKQQQKKQAKPVAASTSDKPVKTHVDQKSEDTVQAVRQRSTKGEIVHHFGSALSASTVPAKEATVNISQLPSKFLYMYDKPQEKTDGNDDFLNITVLLALVEHMYVADQIIEKLQLPLSSHVGSVSGVRIKVIC